MRPGESFPCQYTAFAFRVHATIQAHDPPVGSMSGHMTKTLGLDRPHTLKNLVRSAATFPNPEHSRTNGLAQRDKLFLFLLSEKRSSQRTTQPKSNLCRMTRPIAWFTAREACMHGRTTCRLSKPREKKDNTYDAIARFSSATSCALERASSGLLPRCKGFSRHKVQACIHRCKKCSTSSAM